MNDLMANIDIFDDRIKDLNPVSLNRLINSYSACLARKINNKVQNKKILITILIKIIKSESELLNSSKKFMNSYSPENFDFEYSLYLK